METATELFERHMRINQLGCFLGMKSVVPLMERSGGGSIVNISSVAGLRGSPGAIAYSATKWALRGMTKAAAIDLAPRRIRVNSVHPGPIDTEMLKVRTPQQNQHRVQQVPMKRMGTAEELPASCCSCCRTRAATSPAPRSRSTVVRHCEAPARALAPPHPFAHVRARWIGSWPHYSAEPSSCSWALIMKD
jgi:NAD(P)-dependent dehydrogenase (short-subunit alcohol dehydrogenase family)